MSTNNDCWNLDKLGQRARALLAYGFMRIKTGGFLATDAFEVRLDMPVRNILDGGEGRFLSHALGDARNYYRHYGDPAWAVIHKNDPSWQALPIAELEKQGDEIFTEEVERWLKSEEGK